MSNKDAYWAKTKNHMIVTLVIWAFFSLVIFMFGTELNTMSFLGYPLAYYMTAQGSLLAFVVMLFWTANKQEKIDEDCLLYTSPSPRDLSTSRMPSSA